ncbi:hypothetical protein J3369_21935 [Alteromonas sp. NFXS44]|uniref:hypothetical protein n=1 Tax=Alteromonas sp. NFXS44 TaxID=2818435 RepID=UPI0032E00109
MDMIGELAESVKSSLSEHKKWGTLDAYLYNAGTGIVLLCSGIATYLPSVGDGTSEWIPPILTGLVTFWVALDRALTFGPRWKFHLTQRSGYRRVLDQIAIYSALPDNEKPTQLKKIVAQLELVRSQEPGMPGIDVAGDN